MSIVSDIHFKCLISNICFSTANVGARVCFSLFSSRMTKSSQIWSYMLSVNKWANVYLVFRMCPPYAIFPFVSDLWVNQKYYKISITKGKLIWSFVLLCIEFWKYSNILSHMSTDRSDCCQKSWITYRLRITITVMVATEAVKKKSDKFNGNDFNVSCVSILQMVFFNHHHCRNRWIFSTNADMCNVKILSLINNG